MLHSANFPFDVVGNDSAYFLNKVTLFRDVLTCALFPRVPLLIIVFSLAVVCCSCRAGFGQWKRFWIPVGDTFQKADLEEWLRVGGDSTSDRGEKSIKAIPTATVSMVVRSFEKQRLYC